jgi:mono/diheme cytochrome c family protein
MTTNRTRLLLLALAVGLPTAAGCRQKMSDQPYGRPLSASDMFEDGRMSRPLERGVIHRGQSLDIDPMVTGLTREEWARAYAIQANPKVDFGPAPKEDRTKAIGAPRFDPPGFTLAPGDVAHAGPQIYVNEFPFAITDDDLRRGQERYTIYCAVCHGPLGNGQGKIWERRYLTPTSFHTTKVSPHEVDVGNPRDIPLGHSRTYSLWDIKIGMPDVPVGYIFEVITKGVPGGGMPSYSAQIPPDDRWRIVAYIKVLQLSQRTPAADLPEAIRKKAEAGGKQ